MTLGELTNSRLNPNTGMASSFLDPNIGVAVWAKDSETGKEGWADIAEFENLLDDQEVKGITAFTIKGGWEYFGITLLKKTPDADDRLLETE